MVTRNNSKTTSVTQLPNDWYFIPPTLAGITGVIIGVVIANFLGWF